MEKKSIQCNLVNRNERNHAGTSLYAIIDYISFAFIDFAKDCVFVLDYLPNSYFMLRSFHSLRRIRAVSKMTSKTSRK